MKQGILITAFKNYAQLFEIARFFDDDFAIYIHVDKKSNLSKQLKDELEDISNVKLVSQRYKVNWGGRNHLRCILHLAAEALKNPELHYFHLITGQDFPIKSNDDFKQFFSNNRESDYLENFIMPADCWKNGGMDRIQYYNFYDLLDAKKSIHTIHRLINIQAKLGFKRPLSRTLPPLYGGSTYWSLSRRTLEIVVNYQAANPKLLNRLKHTFCAEEIYFQTIVMNSKYSNRVIGNNLRFILWEEQNGSNPGILDERNMETILASDAFFARKFDIPVSKSLLLKLKEKYS